MANTKLNTTLFGTLEYDSEDGLWEYYTIELHGKTIETRLDIESDLSDEDLVQVNSFIENIPQMVQKSKTVFVEKYSSDETIQTFVDFQLEEIDEDSLLSRFGVDTVSEITPNRFLEELELKGISMVANVECVLDFCLDSEITDALLVVRFDGNMEILDISHES